MRDILERTYNFVPDIEISDDEGVAGRVQARERSSAPPGFTDDEDDEDELEPIQARLDELERFVAEFKTGKSKRVSHETCVFAWWERHEKEFPHLARMAYDYLAIPSSSISAERENSVAKGVWDDRYRLSDELFMKEMCLRSWLNNLDLENVVIPTAESE